MDWNSFLPTFFGTLAGGCLTLFALLVKTSLDKKEIAQNWFEETYIEGAIEIIIEHLESCILYCKYPEAFHDKIIKKAINFFPKNALFRLRHILCTDTLTDLFFLVQVMFEKAIEKQGEEEKDTVLQDCNNILVSLILILTIMKYALQDMNITSKRKERYAATKPLIKDIKKDLEDLLHSCLTAEDTAQIRQQICGRWTNFRRKIHFLKHH